MPIDDKKLQRKIEVKVLRLRRLIDSVGPTPLRRCLDAHLTNLRDDLRRFSQETYEDNENYGEVWYHYAEALSELNLYGLEED